MYNYETEKKSLFTEDGLEMFVQIRDNAKRLLKIAGSFQAERAFENITGSSWTMLACIDKLVEMGEIKELTNKEEVWAQHRIFTDA